MVAVFTLSLFFTQYVCAELSLVDLIRDTVPLRADGKIYISENIKHIKLDIGLSYSAPMSQYWLTHENNLLVFGFEPNPLCVQSILNGAKKLHPRHGDPLDKKFIGTQFFLIPCALGLQHTALIPFYITQKDVGCSSIYKPVAFQIERIVEVPIFRLVDFFDLFPFDTHPVIDYIKIDAQGSDLDIVKSADHYLIDHVIYITLEAENSQYADTANSFAEIDAYMKNSGFISIKSPVTVDPTYFNPRFSEYIKTHNVTIYQNG